MANLFLTPDIIAREALMILQNNTVAANLFYRDYEKEFTGAKVGDIVNIRRPANFHVDEFTSTINIQDVTESNVPIQLEKHFDISVGVTSKELTLDLESFSRQVIAPAMVSMAERVDRYIYSKAIEVNNTYVKAGADVALSDLAQVSARLDLQKVPMSGRIGMVSPLTKAKMLSIPSVVEADKRGDQGSAMRTASIGRVMDIDWFSAQSIAQFTGGTITNGTIRAAVVNGAVAAGATTISVDSTTLTGTVVPGDVFTVAGVVGDNLETSYFVVTNTVTAATNAMNGITFSPAAPAGGFADGLAVTFVPSAVPVTPQYLNLVGHMNGLAFCLVPLELPMQDGNSAIVNWQGLSIRVVRSYDINTKKNVISFDTLVGAKVIDPRLLLRFYA